MVVVVVVVEKEESTEQPTNDASVVSIRGNLAFVIARFDHSSCRFLLPPSLVVHHFVLPTEEKSSVS